MRWHHRYVTIATLELQTGVRSTVSVASQRHQYDVILVHAKFITSLVYEHNRQCVLCSAKFSVTLQTEFFSTETLDFPKQIIFIKSLNSVLGIYREIRIDRMLEYM